MMGAGRITRSPRAEAKLMSGARLLYCRVVMIEGRASAIRVGVNAP